MKTVINDSYGDIGTAVFYRQHQFIPKDVEIAEGDIEQLRESCKADKVQYKGNRTYASLRDFSEYNFQFDIDKDKFNDQFLINLLDDKSKELVGKRLDDLEKVETVLFPTITEDESEEYTEEFFGSTLISNQTFLILEADGSTVNKRGIYKIELYEEGIDSNNSGGGFIEEEFLDRVGEEKLASPVITITLGPGPEVKNNPRSLYFSYDPQLTEKENNERLSLVEYRKLEEEVSMKKAVWILLALDNSVTSINLSYKSWVDNENPNRNMNKYLLRNDEYYSTKDNIRVIKKSDQGNYWFDKNSETLIGNKAITTHPILSRKIAKYRNLNSYSPYVEYKIGDRVTFEGSRWESTSDNNLGHSPILSSYWVLRDRLNNIFTNQVTIVISPNGAGYSNPGGNITVDTYSVKQIRIYETPGYVINELNPCSYDESNTMPAGSFSYSANREPNGEINKVVTILNWSRPIESGKLILNYVATFSTISFNITDNGEEVDQSYENWPVYFNDNIELSKVIVNGVENDPNFNENYELSVYIGDNISLVFPEFTKYSIGSVTSNYIVDNAPNTKEILPEEIINEDGKIETRINDKVDYSSATYILNLVAKTLTISIIESEGFEVSNIISRVSYNSSHSIGFFGDSFSSVTVRDARDNKQIELTEIGNSAKLGESTITLTHDDTNEAYYINIDKVLTNLEIILKS